MGVAKSAFTTLQVIFLVFATISLVAPPGASPALMTSTISDSMTPGITQDELLFVTNQEPEVGDVILFDANQVNRKVLHRIVAVNDDGTFVTQGDANDLTDQRTGFEPVHPDSVYGVAIELPGTVDEASGHPKVASIPVIGAVLTNRAAIFSMWMLLMIMGFVSGESSGRGRGPQNGRRARDSGDTTLKLTVVIAVVIMVAIPVAVMGTTLDENVSIISSSSAPEESDDGRVIAVGHSTNQSVNFTGTSLFGMSQFVEMEGDLKKESIKSPTLGTRTEMVVSNEPSDLPTAHVSQLTIYTIPGTLPRPVLTALFKIHPALAALASASVLSVGLVLAAVLTVDRNAAMRIPREKLRETRPR